MVSMKQESDSRQRQKFTAAFKSGAVRLVIDEGRSVASVARDLGVTVSNLHNWVRQAKVDAGQGRSTDLTTEEKSELARLRKENRILRIERDILKKAAAFFAKEST